MTSTTSIDKPRIFVYMDEGALDGNFKHPSACGVILSEPEPARDKVREAYERLSVSSGVIQLPSFDKFLLQGFHYANDSVDARVEMSNLMPRLGIEWMTSIIINPDHTDPYTLLDQQFEWVLKRISQKYSQNAIEVHFEQNSRLNRSHKELVDRLNETRPSVAKLHCLIEGKTTELLAVADYAISISAMATRRWRDVCCNIKSLSECHEYRTFLGIEGSCSVLHGFDLGRAISSRDDRLGSKSYFQRFATHAAGCKNADSSSGVV